MKLLHSHIEFDMIFVLEQFIILLGEQNCTKNKQLQQRQQNYNHSRWKPSSKQVLGGKCSRFLCLTGRWDGHQQWVASQYSVLLVTATFGGHSHAHTHTHEHKDACMHMCMHTDIHEHTCVHTHTQRSIYTAT